MLFSFLPGTLPLGVLRFADSVDIKVRKQAKQASQQGLQQVRLLALVWG